MKIKLTLLVFLAIQFIYAQQIQWANKLIKYSSDLGGKQFGIKKILGKPDVFPQGGYSPNAWTPKNALDGKEFVVVEFETPQKVQQVAVFENLNAGCVTKIMVSIDGEKFETMWIRKPNYQTPIYRNSFTQDRSYYFGRKKRKIQEIPNVFNPGIEHVIFAKAMDNIKVVKVEFNFALIPGQKQIDAIGISDSSEPIMANLNTTSSFESLENAKKLNFSDFTPSFVCTSSTGEKLFFSKTNINKREEIYSMSKDSNGNWIDLKIETSLKSNSNYNYVEMANDRFILKGGSPYTKGSDESGFEIFEFKNGEYSLVGPIKIVAYNNYDEYSDASITNDLKTLILAIETDFSQGGNDLYFTHQKEDGTYGLLQNMGKIVNSAADESNPQLLSDNKTLLFCSDGFSSFGNTDIYVSHRLDETWKNWSEPINLGSKINSNEIDISPFYDEHSQILYYNTYIDNVFVLKTILLPKAILCNY